MAATKSPVKKASPKKKITRQQFIDKYIEYVLTHNEEPKSIYAFSKAMNVEEAAFYEYFGSFAAIQKHIWTDFINDTLQAVKGDKVYVEYSSREKMLAFYFTLLERMKRDRSYVKFSVESHIKNRELMPAFLKEFKELFTEFAQEVVREGIEANEVAKRPIISERYKDALWLQLVFLVGFWLKDDSVGFEKTDAAIEKSVNLGFELMGGGPLDMMIDFAKFMYQNR